MSGGGVECGCVAAGAAVGGRTGRQPPLTVYIFLSLRIPYASRKCGYAAVRATLRTAACVYGSSTLTTPN